MLNDTENFAVIFRGRFYYCFLVALSILILCSPSIAIESEIFRMSQFDYNGQLYGCRSSALSLEAKSIFTWSTGRHCVLARLLDISVEDFIKIRQKAGGLIIELPKNLNGLSGEAKEHLNLLEHAMLSQPVPIPVYFCEHNDDLERIIDDITYERANKQQNSTALGNLLSSIAANGYQVTVSGANNAANKNSKISIIQGELLSNHMLMKPIDAYMEANVNLPVILITANLKTFGVYNDYPLNTDVAILMLFIEMFSKLNSVLNARPKYRLLFLLSDSGILLNFQGSKKWLDDNVIQNVEFVLCLDTITQSLAYNDDSRALYMHVSKPPKEKTAINIFFKLLKAAAAKYTENVTVEGVHKKINLAEILLSWEHERFSMKRYTAFTISSIKVPKSPLRSTIFKDDDSRILSQTLSSAKVIAEALASYIYKLEEISDIFKGHLEINEEMILPYLGLKSLSQNGDLKDAFEKYLKNVKIIYDKPDVREPDFMFYDGQNAKLNVYRVKPAVFDLFLTIGISFYLTVIYFSIQYFPRFYDKISQFTKEHSIPNGSKAKSF